MPARRVLTWRTKAASGGAGYVSGPFNIVADGNSITGVNGFNTDWPDYLAALRPADTIYNIATPGQYTQAMLDAWTTNVLPKKSLTKTNVYICWESIDSRHDNGVSDANEITKLLALRDLCHANGFLILVVTIMKNIDPNATQTGAQVWADDQVFNTLLASQTGFNGIARPDQISAISDMTDTALWQEAPSGQPGPFGNYTVHPTAFNKQTYLAPMFNAALGVLVA